MELCLTQIRFQFIDPIIVNHFVLDAFFISLGYINLFYHISCCHDGYTVFLDCDFRLHFDQKWAGPRKF